MDSFPRGRELAAIREERAFRSSPTQLWALWTTKEALASWWAPNGFRLTVEALEVRVGGRIDFRYEEAGSAHDPAWGAELRNRGQATSVAAHGVFTEVDPPRRLSFSQELRFGRAGKRQVFRCAVEFLSDGACTRVLLSAESTPSRHWSSLGRANMIGQLERLDRAARPVSD